MSVNAQTPYRFVEIWVPTNRKGRYTNPAHGWATLTAEFIAPLRAALDDRMPPGTELLFHALREGRHFQITWTSNDLWDGSSTRWPDYDVLRAHCKRHGFRIKRMLRGGIAGGGLGGTRWNPPGTSLPAVYRRSCQLLRLMDSVFSLYSESLVPVYGPVLKRGKTPRVDHWKVEAPECDRQNPHGSLFESAVHLIANAAEPRFDVMVTARTRWMHEGGFTASLPCHL